MKVVFQGIFGAYSHLAATEIFSDAQFMGCETFASTLEMVERGAADYAVVPVENSIAGPVKEMCALLPQTTLFVVGEYYFPVHHQLWGISSVELKDIKTAMSHPQALAQCSDFLRCRKIAPQIRTDTVLSCQEIKQKQDITVAAIASAQAGQFYGLVKLAENIENSSNNTTHFLILSRKEGQLKK